MKHHLILIAATAMILVSGCKSVSVHVRNDDENIRLALPFFVVKQALSFSDEAVLEIDDLGGVDQEIDLRSIAKALHEDGDKVKFSLMQDGATITGQKRGKVFCINVDGDDEKVTLNLPMKLMRRIAETPDGEAIHSRELVGTLSKYSGVLIQVESPEETVKISIN